MPESSFTNTQLPCEVSVMPLTPNQKAGLLAAGITAVGGIAAAVITNGGSGAAADHGSANNGSVSISCHDHCVEGAPSAPPAATKAPPATSAIPVAATSDAAPLADDPSNSTATGPEFTWRYTTTGIMGYDWRGDDFDGAKPKNGTLYHENGIDLMTNGDDGSGVHAAFLNLGRTMAKVPAKHGAITAAYCKDLANGPTSLDGTNNISMQSGDILCFTTSERRVVALTDVRNAIGDSGAESDFITYKVTVWNDSEVSDQ